MPRIRLVEIENFRCIRRLCWSPRPGFNALIGPGDVGKSTILDAIDFCIGARRSLTFTDADFHRLDETQPIRIALTIGELPDSLLDIETYGPYLRGFEEESGTVSDEPSIGTETVLTIELVVDATLEPTWRLYSERAAEQEHTRGLSWSQRVRLAPIRLGLGAGYHTAWKQGSLLARLTSDLPDAASSLASAAREARRAFGDQTSTGLQETLESISAAARHLGIQIGDDLRAMLDAGSISLGRGTISLHTSEGIPLQCLGTGSLRLLVAALQRQLWRESAVVLVDELEYGLEPHRIIRLLDTLGAKEEEPPSQVILTTHSPVTVRELSGGSLFVVRALQECEEHQCVLVGDDDAVQGMVRTFPEAMLARVIIVCEGASEVGLLRGLDQYAADQGEVALTALGVIPVNANGASRVVARAVALQALGFRTAILRDSDLEDAPEGETEYLEAGGRVFQWQDGRATEDELLAELPDEAVQQLLAMAVDKLGESAVDAQLRSVSEGRVTLKSCLQEIREQHRRTIATAAKAKRGGWYKTVTDMEAVAREVVGPALPTAGPSLRETLKSLREWASVAASS